MAEKRPSNWQWWALVAGLGVAHFVVMLIVEANFNPPIIRRGPLVKPPWLYNAFMNTFTFPASVIIPAARLGPNDGVLGVPILILTLLLWGAVWAEPFSRKHGWQPWRFSIRELLVLAAIVAVIFGLLVLAD